MDKSAVSRGAYKLLTAIEYFDLTANSAEGIVIDAGTSTGFTDCLLQHGASKVYAVDVGRQLHERLLNPRL